MLLAVSNASCRDHVTNRLIRIASDASSVCNLCPVTQTSFRWETSDGQTVPTILDKLNIQWKEKQLQTPFPAYHCFAIFIPPRSWPVPGSEKVGSTELRKREHEKKTGGNPFTFSFFPPHQLFACLSLMRVFTTMWEPGTCDQNQGPDEAARRPKCAIFGPFLSKIVGCSNHSALIVHDEMSGGFSLAFLSRITFMRPIKLDKALNRLAYVSSTQLAPLAKKLVRSTCSKSSACQVNCPSS